MIADNLGNMLKPWIADFLEQPVFAICLFTLFNLLYAQKSMVQDLKVIYIQNSALVPRD